MIATDVFEHVPDPVALAAKTANHLRIGCHYLIANCFFPVIARLPQLLHFFNWLGPRDALLGIAASRESAIWPCL